MWAWAKPVRKNNCGRGRVFISESAHVEGHTHSDHYHRYRADCSLLPVSDRESSPATLRVRLDSDQSAGFYARQRRRVPLPPGRVRWVPGVWVDGKTLFECDKMVRKILENCRWNRRHAQSPYRVECSHLYYRIRGV